LFYELPRNVVNQVTAGDYDCPKKCIIFSKTNRSTEEASWTPQVDRMNWSSLLSSQISQIEFAFVTIFVLIYCLNSAINNFYPWLVLRSLNAFSFDRIDH
jgi:hypothetical protein